MTLNEWMTNVANSIREKTGSTEKIKATDFATEILNISTGTSSSDLIDVTEFPTTPTDGKIYRMQSTVLDGTAIYLVINGVAYTPAELGYGATYYEVEELPELPVESTQTNIHVYINKNEDMAYLYIGGAWATLTEALGGDAIFQGVVTDKSQAVNEGWYIKYGSLVDVTKIGANNENGDIRFYEYKNNEYFALNSNEGRVVVIDNDNLPDNPVEGTIYLRNNVPVYAMTNNGRTGSIFELLMIALGGGNFFEYGIICDALPENPLAYTAIPLRVTVYYLRNGNTYIPNWYDGTNWQQLDSESGLLSGGYIAITNEIWYFREGKYVKISKFGLTDEDIADAVVQNSGATYTGNSYAITMPMTKREYIVDGISGALTKDDFEWDTFDGNAKVRVGALAGCTGVTSIEAFEVIHDEDYISAAAFYGCTGLTEVNITAYGGIKEHAFYGCTALTTVYIYVNELGLGDNEYAIIGDYAFANCTSLTDIHFSGTMAQWNGGTFGRGWNENTGNYTIHCTDGDIAKS